MPQTLTAEMSRKTLDTLLKGADEKRASSEDDARELLRSGDLASLILDHCWDTAQGFLNRGIESRKLCLLIKEFLEVLELGIKALASVEERVKAAELTPVEKREGESRLQRARQRAQQRSSDLLALLRWLETPRPITASSPPGGREKQDPAGYMTLEELTARLRSDGRE